MYETNRRGFLALALCACALGAFPVNSARADAPLFDADTLKKKLRVTTEAQSDFVDDVIRKEQNGELPSSMLRASYRYAMGKEASRRIYFFRLCLANLVKRAGLKIEFLPF